MGDRLQDKLNTLSIEKRIIHYESLCELLKKGVSPYESVVAKTLEKVIELRKEKIKKDHCEIN